MTASVLLVHGAFADTSVWADVVKALRRAGIDAIAVANPLAGLRSDAAYVASLAQAAGGSVVLAGHDYGGAVITATDAANVCGLVYVAAFAPDAGETCVSVLAPRVLEALRPAIVDRGVELRLDRYRELIAADLPGDDAAALQRPILAGALDEPAPAPAWRRLPSWYVVAGRDRLIAAGTQRALAARAGAQVIELDSAHALPRSRPDDVAMVIASAAG